MALQEFILIAAQREAGAGGGFRDKPGKRPDLYHTCNNLSGLAIAQHHMVHSSSKAEANRAKFDPSKGFPTVQTKSTDGNWKSDAERQEMRRSVWSNALAWEIAGENIVGGVQNRVVSPSRSQIVHR